MELSTLQKIQLWISALVVPVVLPLVIAYWGHRIEQAALSRQVAQTYLSMAVGIMSKKSDGTDEGTRQWAIKVMEKYSPIPLPGSMKGLKSLIIYKPGPEVLLPVPVFPSPPTELMECRSRISPLPAKMFEESKNKEGEKGLYLSDKNSDYLMRLLGEQKRCLNAWMAGVSAMQEPAKNDLRKNPQ